MLYFSILIALSIFGGLTSIYIRQENRRLENSKTSTEKEAEGFELEEIR